MIQEKNIKNNVGVKAMLSKKHDCFLLNLYLIVFCLSALCAFYNHDCMFVAIASMIACSIVLGLEETTIMFVFAYPFEALFHFSIFGTTENIFPYVYSAMFFVVGIKYLIKIFKKKEKLDFVLLIMMAAFLVYLVLPINKIKLVDYVQYVAAMAIVYLLFKQSRHLNIKRIINYAVVGLAISVLMSVVLQFYNSYSSVYENYYTDGLLKLQGLFVNPNYLMMFVCLLSAVLKTEFIKKASATKLVQWAFVFVVGYTTLSRNFLVCDVAISLILLILYIARKDKTRLKNLAIISAVGVGLMLLLFTYTKVYYIRLKEFIKKLLSGDSASGGGPAPEDEPADPGRILIWKRYLKSFFASAKSVFFGYGISAPALRIKAHNTYIQGFWQIGVIGMALLCVISAKTIFNKRKDKNVLYWVVLAAFLVLSFFESNLLNTVFLIFFALLMASGRKCDE